jgi:uncharacterized membrane protein
MSIIVAILEGVLTCYIWGIVIYIFASKMVPEKYSEKFFEIVPLYPKPKYAILLYSLSGILYFGISYKFYGGFVATFWAMITIAPLCIIASSQIVRAIAHSKKENVEESQEEEIKRKRENRFNL